LVMTDRATKSLRFVALFDLKRVLYLANHFKIKCGIIINKYDLENKFYLNIERYAKKNKIPILGKIPYRKDFIQSTVKMRPVVEINTEYKKLFQQIINKIK